ncbi:hypothetical protein MWU60_15565 [Yoonia sp. F2084L]|uniref:hypothetical protein n=1 Tax=Yoonia sp. F2084L TaxID=2926419 RepID=UPI001FF62524|nr:hypothetical protein [Yoonia sp. F2084L]MCK0096994.1 hypothetical protein [Yoonia sp. F2084L]
MTTFTSTTLTALVLAATASFASAQEFSLEVDALSLTPSVSDGFGDDDNLGAETSVRAKAGYTFANGAGVRLQYWDMDVDYDEGQAGNPTEIQVQQIDLIGFREFEVTPGLDLELSAGVRSLEFDDLNFADAGITNEHSFEGIGAVFGVKATQAVFRNGGVYGSFETAALFGDLDDNGNDDPQSNLSQMAIGFGYEHTFAVGATATTLKIGYEAQEWIGIEDSSDGSFGFDGLVLGAAVSF